KDYEEGFVRAQLSVILEERLERESEEKIQQQREFELEKMRLEIERSRFNSENLSPLKTSVTGAAVNDRVLVETPQEERSRNFEFSGFPRK
ncbi:hypothetical protein TNCV_615411, partial [Trichonephila clavipes]